MDDNDSDEVIISGSDESKIVQKERNCMQVSEQPAHCRSFTLRRRPRESVSVGRGTPEGVVREGT